MSAVFSTILNIPSVKKIALNPDAYTFTVFRCSLGDKYTGKVLLVEICLAITLGFQLNQLHLEDKKEPCHHRS